MIDFDRITPNTITRPEICRVCLDAEDAYFGRLNFRLPSEAEWPAQYCPMHTEALKDGTLTNSQILLVPTGGKVG